MSGPTQLEPSEFNSAWQDVTVTGAGRSQAYGAQMGKPSFMAPEQADVQPVT
jgi:hypothetical protein